MPNARILVVLTVLLSVICGMAARAEEALPSQVGRISAANGAVSLRPASGEWTTASINDPIATGMAVRAADRARAGIGIGALRSVLAGGSEADIARLDDAMVQIALKQGRIGIHLARLDAGTAIEIDLPQGGVWLLAPGDYDDRVRRGIDAEGHRRDGHDRRGRRVYGFVAARFGHRRGARCAQACCGRDDGLGRAR
jgi:hypothetical protein